MFCVSGTAYAYWDQTVVNQNSTVIDIGIGAILEVDVTVTPEEGNRLVPVGAFKGEGDVDEVFFTYTVNLNKIGQVLVTAKNVMIDGDYLNNSLVLIDVYATTPNVVPSDTATFTLVDNGSEEYEAEVNVRVMISMPADEAQYNMIAGKTITFVLEFSAEEV